MDVHDVIRHTCRPDVLVTMQIEIPEATALWLLWLAEQHGDTPQHQAASILTDVRIADQEAHGEEPSTLQ